MKPKRLACAICIAGLAVAFSPGTVRAQPALPQTIPIFPLPDAVLFPNVSLGLYIFEARYRAMLGDALEGNGVIGMVQLQPGYEKDYAGRPPINPIGCAGVVTEVEPMPDGRIKVVMRGLVKFRVISEDNSRRYRMARVDPLPERLDEEDKPALREQRERLEAMLAAPGERSPSRPTFSPALSDEDLINAASQYLNVGPLERQALLERPGVLSRAQALLGILEKLMPAR